MLLDHSLCDKTSGCWLWTKGVAKDGYARLKRKGKMISAHRASWIDNNGAVPEGLCVLHKCDVRNCVNPEHLFLGTHRDNTLDMMVKGRKPPVSDSFRFSMKGKPHSEQHRKRIGEANSRRVIKQETREKRRVNALNQWAKRLAIKEQEMKKTAVKQPAKKLVFQIEQIALAPIDTKEAMKLLKDMGIGDFVKDRVVANGAVFGSEGSNVANLKFNYTALKKARELEVLEYTSGPNWIQEEVDCVSHIGMHCTAEELAQWRKFFAKRKIAVVQEVMTQSHSNPVIKGKRWYNYVIFDTRSIIGTDVKFIVRLPAKGTL